MTQRIRRSRPGRPYKPRQVHGFEPLEQRTLLTIEPLGNEQLVNDSITRNQLTSSDAHNVAVAADGGFAVTFAGRATGDDTGVFIRRFDSSRSPRGPVERVNRTTHGIQHSPHLAMNAAGEHVVAWAGRGVGDHEGVFARSFAATGSTLSAEFLVNATTGGRQEQPVAAVGADGTLTLAWSGVGAGDFDGVFWRRFQSDGTPLTPEIRGNQTIHGRQAYPAIGVAHDGTIVMAWSSRHQDGSDWGVFGRRFAPSGTVLGDEFQLNSNSLFSQAEPAISVASDGAFIVTWSSFAGGDDSWDVYARRFDASMQPQGDEFLVNDAQAGHQRNSKPAMLDDGTAVVVWQDGVPDGSGWEVLAREVTASGDLNAPLLANQRTNGYASGHQQIPSPAVTEFGDVLVAFSGNGIEDHGGVYVQQLRGSVTLAIDPIPDRTIDELTLLSVDANATSSSPSQIGYFFERSPAGATIDPQTGLISWTPTESQGPGVYPFTVVANLIDRPNVRDEETFIVTVLEVNQSPTLDPIADQSIVEETQLSFTVTGTDPDIPPQRLLFLLDASAPAGATLDPITGEFRWTPNEAQGPGTYPVTIRVADQGNPELTDSQTLTITVLEHNRPPVISDIQDIAIDAFSTLVVALSATDPDVPANVLMYRLDAGPSNATLDETTGLIHWIPREQDVDTIVAFTVTVFDNGIPSLSDTTTFQVAVSGLNSPPDLDAIPDQVIDELVPFTWTATASDPDAPADILRFSLEDKPANATIDLLTGRIDWTPTESQGPGDYVFTVVVTDSGNPALSDSEVFVVTVREVNLPPVLQPVPAQTVPEETTFTLTLQGTDADLPANLLTYSITSGPANATINALTGVITWTPTEVQGPGEFVFDVRLTDNGSPPLSATQTFTVDVLEVNRPPLISPVDAQSIAVNAELVVALTATDPDIPANSLTFSLVSGPPRSTISPEGLFRWTPLPADGVGPFQVEVRVSDNGSPVLTDTTSFQIAVSDECAFGGSLGNWQARQTGGSAMDMGTVTVNAACEAVLVEGDSFTVSLESTFLIPGGATSISFEYVDLAFDSTSTGLIKDAFEAALLDGDGNSLVPTYLAGRDAFFNITDGLFVQTGSKTSVTGTTVTLDVSDVPESSEGRLVLRLVNNDGDNASSVRIVAFAPPSVSSGSFASAGMLARTEVLSAQVRRRLERWPAQQRLFSRAHLVSAMQLADAAVVPVAASATAFIDGPEPTPVVPANAAAFDAASSAEPMPTFNSLGARIEWMKTSYLTLPNYNQVMTSPVVIDLDRDGIPSIIYATFAGSTYTSDGVLRAIRGDGRVEEWSIEAPALRVLPVASIAAGDIDHDGFPEIIAVHESNEYLIAFNHDGSLAWTSDEVIATVAWGGPSIADLDNDGEPEIVLGASVFDNKGRRLWGHASGGQGDNWYGPLSIVADLDLDGRPEVVAGSSAYHADGSPFWDAGIDDGFPAIGNFDADQYPEIVVVAFDRSDTSTLKGNVYLLEHTGEVIWGPKSLPGGGRGGAPTIADFDNDGRPEIGVAGASNYAVFDDDGSLKWSVGVVDGSSNTTGSSVFDFDGNGTAEVVYGDEHNLRVYNGQDGAVLYELPKGSGTTYELPVIADVDGDGHTEILGVANNYAFGQEFGLFVVGSVNDSWVPTRKIWNQHSYHITNINDDGTIPAVEPQGWLIYNNYRRNLQPTGTQIGPPTISVSSSQEYMLAGSQVVLSGRAIADRGLAGTLDNRIVLVTINGTPVEVLDANRNFFTRVEVPLGMSEYVFRATDQVGQTASTIVRITGEQLPPGAIDFRQFADITGSFGPVYGRTSFNDDSDILHVDLATRNDGTFRADVPLLVGVKNITDQTVSLVGVDGFTPEGIPYFDFTRHIPTQRLEPGQVSLAPTIRFHTPSERQFRYELVFYGKLNQAPTFTTLPVVEALVGRPYRYDADANDPDGDPLVYQLAVGPPIGTSSAAFDTGAGVLNWVPGPEDIGKREIVLRASDGRGGVAEQRFVISVVQPPPNRPPVFVTTPVVSAEVAAPIAIGSRTFDLSRWNQFNVPVIGPPHADPPVWLPVGANSVYKQLNNADASFLLSDETFINVHIEGDIRVDTEDDDDNFGIVFGFEDSEHFYQWEWNQRNEAIFQPAMSVRRVASDAPINQSILYGGPNPSVTDLYVQEIGWKDFTTYHFELDYRPDRFEIKVFEGELLIADIEVTATMPAARFGFSNQSQANVIYSGFEVTSLPPETYRYDSEAVDADHDVIAYAIIDAPEGMQINSRTGLLTWAPTAEFATQNRTGVTSDLTLPVVPGFDVGVYADVESPIELSFDQLGDLFVGRDSEIGDIPEQLFRISRADGSALFGPATIPDPDSVLVDRLGQFGEVPGAVLVAGYAGAFPQQGQINAILPDGTARVIVPPSSQFANPHWMTIDSLGRLLFVDVEHAQLLSFDGQSVTLLAAVDADHGIATSPDGFIYAFGSDGRIAKLDLSGNVLNPNFASGLGAGSTPVYATAAGWTRGLYLVDSLTGELVHLDDAGVRTVIGTRFIEPAVFPDIEFGLDGAMYLSDRAHDRIIRIAPSLERRGLGNGQCRVVIGAADGRGGVAYQEFAVCVRPAGDNKPPVIVSEPPSSFLHAVLASSTFNDGFDGWSPSQTPNEIDWQTTGGNSGGYLRYVQAPIAGPADVIAPAKFHGDWSSLQGSGSISFDQKVIDPGPSISGIQTRQIRISGPNGSAIWNAPPPLAVPGDWVTFTAPLVESAWTITEGEWDSLLENVTDVRIRVELFGNDFGSDVSGLDNVFVGRAAYRYDVEAVDPDGDVIRYRLAEHPDGMTIDESTGFIDWPTNVTNLNLTSITFSDSEFSFDDWLRAEEFSHGLGGTVTWQSADAGGNPGGFLNTVVSVADAPNPADTSWAAAFFLRAGAVYRPSQQGAILAIDYAEDTISSASQGVHGYSGIAFRQNGKVYAAVKGVSGSSPWTTHQYPQLLAKDFVQVDESSIYGFDYLSHPDFSSTGAEIEFGFIRGGVIVIGQVAIDFVSGHDNWRVTVVPVPEADVEVTADDGRGGVDTQRVTITGAKGAYLYGTVFADGDANGVWDKPSILVTSGRGVILAASSGRIVDRAQTPIGYYSVVVGPDGKWYATDSVNDQILRIDPRTGDLIDIFVSSRSGGLITPSFLTFGPDGNLYVSSDGAHAVLRYNGTTGEFMDVFAFVGDETPRGLAFGAEGDLYVTAARFQGHVRRFEGTTGASLGTFASYQGDQPADLAFFNDKLYVSYFLLDTVVEFSGTTGEILRTIAEPGEGGLDNPNGLTVDANGVLYVASMGTGKVLRYDTNTGDFLGIAAEETLPRGFTDVLAVPADSNDPETGESGRVVFLDQNANGRRDANEFFAITDSHGGYEFQNLPAGHYRVSLEPVSGSHQTYPIARSHLVTLEAADELYGIDFGSAPADASDEQSPEFLSSPTQSALATELYRYDAVAIDPDGEALTFDLPAAPRGMSVHPTLGVVVWIPQHNDIGAHQVVLRAQDANGGVTTQVWTIVVEAANVVPVIVSLPSPGPVTIGLPFEYKVVVQYPDNDAIRFDLATAVPGAMINATSGRLLWTPQPGQTPIQTFTIIANDGRGGIARQTIEIAVAEPTSANVNEGPVVTSSPPPGGLVGVPFAYAITATDRNGDPLTFTQILGPQSASLNDEGVLAWLPRADELGLHQFRVQVSDGRGAVTIHDFDVIVTTRGANQPPAITSIPRTLAISRQLYEYDLKAVDAERDSLLWELVVAPPGMSISPTNATLRWLPADEQMGEHPVVVRARDVAGNIDEQRFVVTVNCLDLPPQITSTPLTVATVNATYIYAVRAVDPEGRPLSFGALGGLLPNMSLDARTGILRWTPTADQAGANTLVLQAQDEVGNAATQEFTIVVNADPANRAPNIESTPGFNATVGAAYSYQVLARDPEGDSLVYNLLQRPEGMQIDAAGRVTWEPGIGDAGEDPSIGMAHTVVVAVQDSRGAVTSQGYVLSVRQNLAPSIESTPGTTVAEGATYRYDVRARDPNNDTLTYILDAHPAGMTVDEFGRILWTPPAGSQGSSQVVVLRVLDPFGAQARQEYTIHVIADVAPPTVRIQVARGGAPVASGGSVDAGNEVTFIVSAVDNVAVASLTLSLDGQFVTLDANGRAKASFPIAKTVVAIATATDSAGNVGTSQVSINVVTPAENNRPDLTNPSLPPNPGLDPNDTREPLVTLTRFVGKNGQLIKQLDGNADEANVTNTTKIFGTVDDPEDRLWYYDVLYARIDQVDLTNIDLADPDFRRLARGTQEVIDGELATFDPTILSRDPYAIVLVAFDFNGQGFVTYAVANVEGNLQLGNFRLEFNDLSLPVAGIPVTITRVYDTLQADTEGDFGFGWSLGVRDARIRETVPAGQQLLPGKSKVYLTNPQGQRVGFTYFEQQATDSCFVVCIFDPYFVGDPGVFDKLETEGQATRGGEDGALFGGINPDVYTLTTPDGSRYQYHQATGLQSVVDTNGNTLLFGIDGISANGQTVITFHRDGRGRIERISYPALDEGNQPVVRELTYRYDAIGDLRSFSQPVDVTNQLTTRFTYKAAPKHYLDEIIDPRGVIVSKTEYDTDGRIVRVTDANGNVVIYDRSGRDENLERIQDSRGIVSVLKYDDFGNVTEERQGEHVNDLGQAVYDSIKRYAYVYERDGVNSPNRDKEWKVTQVFLDGQGHELKQVTVEYDYDVAGNVTKVIDFIAGERLVRTFTYNSLDKVKTVTDEKGRTTVFGYDDRGNLKDIVNAAGDASHIAYDAQGRATSYTDFRGFTTRFEYDGNQSQPARIFNPDHTDAVPSMRLVEYNAYGQVTKSVDEEGIVTLYQYDATGQKTFERIGEDAPVRYVYDNNLLIRKIVARSEVEPGSTDMVSEYGYTNAGLVRYETDALGAVTGYEYDPAGNRTFLGRWNSLPEYNADMSAAVASPNAVFAGRYPSAAFEHVFVYDRLGRVDYELDDVQLALAETASVPLDQISVRLDYDYDSAGNRMQVVDRNGRVRTFEYDERNRMIGEQWFADLADTTPDRSFVWSYCACGAVAKATEYSTSPLTSEILSQYVYSYDVLNRVTSVDNIGTKDMPRVVLSYAYDKNGNRVSVSDNLGVAVKSIYDNRNRLDMRWWENTTPTHAVDEALVDFSYYRNGREKELNRYTGKLAIEANRVGRTLYADPDASGRIQKISHQNAAGGVLAEYIYRFDNLGLVDGLSYDDSTVEKDGVSDPYDFSVDYIYDNLGQLTDADYSDSTTARGIYVDEFYRYDKNGNRVDSHLHSQAQQGDGESYVAGNGNRLLSDGTFNYRYDNDGNMTRKIQLVDGQPAGEVTVFEYDHRNRMTRATKYSRSPEENGIIVGESRNRYDSDGRRLTHSIDADGTGPNPTVVNHMIHNGQDTWADFDSDSRIETRYFLGYRIDQTISRWTHDEETGGRTAWYLLDQVGTIRQLVEQQSAVTTQIAYGSFGNILVPSPVEFSDRFMFTSREFEVSLDQYFYRTRFYDAITGRFGNHDSLGFQDGLNLFRYVGNSPLGSTDPTGKQAVVGYGQLIRLTSFAIAGGAIVGSGCGGGLKGALFGGIAGGVGLLFLYATYLVGAGFSIATQRAILGTVNSTSLQGFLFTVGSYVGVEVACVTYEHVEKFMREVIE